MSSWFGRWWSSVSSAWSGLHPAFRWAWVVVMLFFLAVIVFGCSVAAAWDYYPAAQVPWGGAKLCYDSSGSPMQCGGTGQDADGIHGVPWPHPRFTVNGDGTVTDRLTGVIWLREARCTDLMAWQAALNWSAQLADGQCGLTDGSEPGDWRLPAINELQSLVCWQWYAPAVANTEGTGQWVEGDPFFVLTPYYYWSSTTYAYAPAYALTWSAFGGWTYAHYKASPELQVWAVRGGR